MQLAPKAVVLCEMRSDRHSVQGHSRSLILVQIVRYCCRNFGHKLVLFTKRKSHVDFRFVPKCRLSDIEQTRAK